MHPRNHALKGDELAPGRLDALEDTNPRQRAEAAAPVGWPVAFEAEADLAGEGALSLSWLTKFHRNDAGIGSDGEKTRNEIMGGRSAFVPITPLHKYSSA